MATVVLAWAITASAQTGSVQTENGFQPNRDYLALQPFEAIDTASGNVVLTFTDLSLPGNGGRSLTFTRVFNNTVMEANGLQWRFGISGIPLKVTVATIQVGQQIQNSIDGEGLFAFSMPDGSCQRTTFMLDPNTTTQQQVDSTTRWLTTPALWKYDRIARLLYMPDGIIAQYDGSGRLQSYSDQFGNAVNLTWAPGLLTVDQVLGNGQVRTVVLTMNDAAMFPSQMTYNGNSWNYTLAGAPYYLLQSAQPPIGGSWVYEYTGTSMWRITTPQSGQITYGYDFFSFIEDPVLQTQQTFYTLKTRDAYDGAQSGHWEFSYLISSPQPGGILAGSRVTLPSLHVVEHQYAPTAGAEALAGGWSLVYRVVLDTDGQTPLESETREYIPLEAARPSRVWSVTELKKRRVTRLGQTFETEYVYSADVNSLRGYHRPSQIIERRPGGQVARTTSFSYQHMTNLSPYILGLTTGENTTVGTETVSRSWTYNPATGFRESENVSGITTTFAPDALGNVATVTKANGKSTSFAYTWGQVSQTTTPHVVTTRGINPDGTVQSETVAGRTTFYDYDDLGRVIEVRPPGGDSLSARTVTTYTNNTVTTTRGNSRVTTTLDGFGRPIETVNSLGVRTRTAYDAEGRVIQRGLPFTTNEIRTEIAYDGLGRVTRETNPDGSFRTRTYGSNTVTVTDENSHSTTMTYSAFGHPDDARLTGVLDAANSQWTYGYNAAGNLSSVSGPGGVTRTWVYNSQNLLQSETRFESGTTSYTSYDAAGVLKGKTDANGTQFVYGHDGNDRLTSVTAGGRTTTIAYEPGSDNRVSTTVDNHSTQYGYDPVTGRLLSRTDTVDGKPFIVKYGYDASDNVAVIVYPSGRSVGYQYDEENRIKRVFNAADTSKNYAWNMDYHPSGGVSSFQAGSNLWTSVGYDPQRYWVNSISVGGSLLQLGYGYDPVGNVTSLTDAAQANANQTFTYDALDRLATANSNGFYPSNTFTYDAHGNRQTAGYTYQAGNPFRLQSFGAGTMTYDNNGNLRTGPQEVFTYTPGNLLEVSTAGSTTARFTYDADDWRVKKSVDGGKTFYYVRGPNGQMLTEWDNSSPTATVKDYVYAGSRLIAVVNVSLAPK